MKYYWETYRKRYHNHRLEWYGESPDEQYWADYWHKTITTNHYERLNQNRLNDSPLGRILSRELRKTDQIIEAGCGAGDWVAILQNNGYLNVLGMDYSDQLVQRIRQINPDLPILCGDSLQIPEKQNTYDAYLSFGVVEHRVDGMEPFLREAHRVLKPGGKVFLSVPCMGFLRKLKAHLGFYRDDPGSYLFFQYGFTAEELRSCLHQTGFRVGHCHYLGLDRLLIEEFWAYRKLAQFNTVRRIQKAITRAMEGQDGHMILAVAEAIK